MSDFDSFKKAFKGDLVTPSDSDYADAIKRWAANASRKAAIVAFVKDPEDVALAITYSRKAGLPIAIRGGAHSPSGSSSSENGLVIDLSKYLNHVRVDTQAKLAYAGGGALWGAVDRATIEHGLATVGGTVNHTGLGGLIVGGGYGWLSGEHGLVIDNLVQVTVVTANGSILTASKTENPDLFWAIRGGGSNFGVVTEFVLRLHPQRRTVFAGPLIFTPDKAEAVAAAVEEWWSRGPSPKEGVQHVHTAGPDGRPCAIAVIFYNGPADEGRKIYKSLYDIGPVVDQTGEIPYENMNTLQNPLVPWGRCAYMKGVLRPKDFSPAKEPEILKATSKAITHGGYHVVLVREYYPMDKMNSVPNDATAYQRALEPNVLSVLTWEDDTPENLKTAKELAYEMLASVTGGTPRATVPPAIYGNYTLDQDVTFFEGGQALSSAEILFRDNYPKLQQIKKKYDPEVVFNKWFAITPAP